MRNNEIKSIIEDYLKKPTVDYAVMIDGEWGAGKTYFLRHSLIEIMKNMDSAEKKRRYAYVSLYGLKSINEISREILFQYFGQKNRKRMETANNAIKTASSIITASLGGVNIDLSKGKRELLKINVHNWIICFDDLERCCLPINEVLGYINHFVEHNNCKVIVIANEKEIGRNTLSQNLEKKYQVVLSGRKLRLGKGNSNKKNEAGEIDIKALQKETEKAFNEDIVYKIIKEKVIGVTIRYEPDMSSVYNSVISHNKSDIDCKEYLKSIKSQILNYFKENDCYNIRILIYVIGIIQKVYEEMNLCKIDFEGFDKYKKNIMGLFLEYIVLLAIYYKNGGNVSELSLTDEVGYVNLGKNSFHNVRGFKVLETYCTMSFFSKNKFKEVVSILYKECKHEEKRKLDNRAGKAYSKLKEWWKLEDKDVIKNVKLLWQEIEQDKYAFYTYSGIIGLLMSIKAYGHNIKNIDELIDVMKKNIEKSEETVDFELQSFSFPDNPKLQKEYNRYIAKLEVKANKSNQTVMASDLLQLMKSENWAEKLFEYCDKHYDDFILRYGFIDLLDIDLLVKKIKNGTTSDVYLIKNSFHRIYFTSNIDKFFAKDVSKIEKFRDEVMKIKDKGINKKIAIELLVEYLNDIIKRLAQESNAYKK